MNFELAKLYFNPPRKKGKGGAIVCFIFGALLTFFNLLALIGGLTSTEEKRFTTGTWIVVGVFLAIGIALIFLGVMIVKKVGRYNRDIDSKEIPDQAYDQMIGDFLENMKNTRALQALGIDASEVQEIRPLIFGGYKILGANRFKKGKDGLYRTNVYEAVIIYFSANDVHCYTCNFHTTEPNMTEATDVYFYRDIVSVSTMQETEKIGASVQPTQKFVLTTTGGTRLSVSLTQREDTDRSINAMRSLLREKKQSMA